MLQSIKSLALFAFAIFALDAKITFKSSELSPVFEKKIQSALKKIVRQFSNETRKAKEQLLNMIIITFIGNEKIESLMNADEKTQAEFTKKIESFIERLTPETMALQKEIGEVFNTIITKEMEKGKEGYFGSIESKEDFDREFAKLSVTYQLAVYDELYATLKSNEQKEFCDVLLLTNSGNKKAATKKLLPKPEELYAVLPETIERTLKFMNEIAQLAASQEQEGASVNK